MTRSKLLDETTSTETITTVTQDDINAILWRAHRVGRHHQGPRVGAGCHTREFVDKYAYVADFGEIKENDFNLNIPCYVNTFEPEPDVDMAAVAVEIVETDAELAEVEAEMRGIWRSWGYNVSKCTTA